MIVNFEEITKELTDYELKVVVPVIIKGLETKIGKENSVTNKSIIEGLYENKNIKIPQARVRKIIQYIRLTGSVERLVGTSKGYYICNREDELRNYVNSLLQRADSIEQIAKQLDFQTNKYINNINNN